MQEISNGELCLDYPEGYREKVDQECETVTSVKCGVRESNLCFFLYKLVQNCLLYRTLPTAAKLVGGKKHRNRIELRQTIGLEAKRSSI